MDAAYYNRHRVAPKTHPTHCHYCGRDVFYYENEHGVRVLFEALGKPWAKHRCREYLNRKNKTRLN